MEIEDHIRSCDKYSKFHLSKINRFSKDTPSPVLKVSFTTCSFSKPNWRYPWNIWTRYSTKAVQDSLRNSRLLVNCRLTCWLKNLQQDLRIRCLIRDRTQGCTTTPTRRPVLSAPLKSMTPVCSSMLNNAGILSVWIAPKTTFSDYLSKREALWSVWEKIVSHASTRTASK